MYLLLTLYIKPVLVSGTRTFHESFAAQFFVLFVYSSSALLYCLKDWSTLFSFALGNSRFTRLTGDQCPCNSQIPTKKVTLNPYIYAKEMKNP